jgi:hypothetical protein
MAERLGRWTSKELAAETGSHIASTRSSIRMMHKHGLIHIAAWTDLRGMSGHPLAIYQWGEGVDAIKPRAPGTKAQRQTRRVQVKRAQLTARYGQEVARKILNARKYGGAEAIVIDGKTIYRRGPTPERFRESACTTA